MAINPWANALGKAALMTVSKGDPGGTLRAGIAEREDPTNPFLSGYVDDPARFSDPGFYNKYLNYRYNTLGNRDFGSLSESERGMLFKYGTSAPNTSTLRGVSETLAPIAQIAATAAMPAITSGVGNALLGSLGMGATGATMGPIAGLQGAESALLGGNAGGYLGATGGSMLGGMGLGDWLTIGGDALGAYGEYKAADKQADAIRQAQQGLQAAGQYGQQAYAPYSQAGMQGLAGLLNIRDYDATSDPQYQNQLAEMMRAMNARSAAAGMGQSSADLLQRAAGVSDLYGQSYGREYNRLGDLVNLGQYGTTGQVGARLGQAQGVGNLQLQGGQVAGNQLANLYGGIGDVMALPSQISLNQQYINALNRGVA